MKADFVVVGFPPRAATSNDMSTHVHLIESVYMSECDFTVGGVGVAPSAKGEGGQNMFPGACSIDGIPLQEYSAACGVVYLAGLISHHQCFDSGQVDVKQ